MSDLNILNQIIWICSYIFTTDQKKIVINRSSDYRKSFVWI